MFRDSIILLFIMLLVGCSPTYQPSYYESPSYLFSPPNQLPSFELQESSYSFDEFTNSIILKSFEDVDTLGYNFIGKYSLMQIWMTETDTLEITTTIALNTVALTQSAEDVFAFEEAEITNYGEVELILVDIEGKEPTSYYDSGLVDITYLIRIPNEYLGDVMETGFNVRLTNYEEAEVTRFNISSDMVNSLIERMAEIAEMMGE